ncbi:hypothetical protein [Streptomyces sp. NPDC101150]|uniref:hypothetical protein n=1 Tax=Streptomyces sp. NPDC101150 TaxID=3366114 RepID=UPI0037FB8DAF
MVVHQSLSTEASTALSPWLSAWEAQTGPTADGHLAAAAEYWESYLLGDRLPWDTWDTWDDEEELRAELTAWLVRHAPDRLRAHGVSGELLHRIRLLGLSGPDRWEDPHWPGHR